MRRKIKRKAKPARAKRPAKAMRKTQVRSKTHATDAIDAMVAVNAQALGLSIDPAWHASVAFNLRLILRFGALVAEFELPDDAEPAPIFHA